MKAWMDPFWLTHEHLVVPTRVVETGAVGLGLGEARPVENERELAPVVRHGPDNADAGRLHRCVRQSGTAQTMPTLGAFIGACAKAARLQTEAHPVRPLGSKVER